MAYQESQASVFSRQCPTGGKEAEELFQLARRYYYGAKGFPRDLKLAEKLYEEAMHMGNAKAPLFLAQMYRREYGGEPNREARLKYSFALYERSRDMGCPEAYQGLAQCYDEGWGVKRNLKKAIELLRKGAEAGGIQTMGEYGHYVAKNINQREGMEWMQKAFALGYVQIAWQISMEHYGNNNVEGMITARRAGAAAGSTHCLISLANMYDLGSYGQPKNEAYSQCLERLRKTIDEFDPPSPIKDFDKLCPHPPIVPYDIWKGR